MIVKNNLFFPRKKSSNFGVFSQQKASFSSVISRAIFCSVQNLEQRVILFKAPEKMG